MIEQNSIYIKRKQDMMELWKETFGDSDRYINLVFDNYYSLENTYVKYEGEQLVAALLSIPYELILKGTDGGRKKINGMYLCGLATHPEWRRKGIMGQLMSEAENNARERGFDITFLIPADEHLRRYYEKKGYWTASHRKICFYSNDNLKTADSNSSMNIYTIRDFFKDRPKFEFLKTLACWCRNIEISRTHPTILHSQRDLLVVMEENENSIFLTDSTFNPEFPILAKVCAVAFPEFPEGRKGVVRINAIYQRGLNAGGSYEDTIFRDNENEVIKTILGGYTDFILERVMPYLNSGEEKRGEDIGIEPYAMVKQVSNREIFNKNANLEIEIALMLD